MNRETPNPAAHTPAKPVPAETARQEGAQGRVGKPPDDPMQNGEADASDPTMTEKPHAKP